MGPFRLSILACAALLVLGCNAIRQQRVVVVAAHAPRDAPEPIAGATARIECPTGIAPPAEGATAETNERGEAILAADGSVSSACVVTVARDGYVTERFRIADVCLESGEEEPFQCSAGVAFTRLAHEGEWSDAEAGSAAAALTNECFTTMAWAGDSKPSLRLHRSINKTDQHIDVRAVGDRILAAAVASPRVRVLEMKRGNDGPNADFHLTLEISSITAMPREGVTERTYNTTARVVRVRDQEIVCQATAVRKTTQVRANTAW